MAGEKVPEDVLRWSGIAVEPGWIDYNGHLNMAAYLVVFDRAVDRLIERVGLSAGPGTAPTIFAASAKVDYRREVGADERMDCLTGVIALDGKRVHTWQELRVGGDVRACCENLHVHVDRAGPRAVPFAPDVRARLEALIGPAPEWTARAVAHRMGSGRTERRG